MPDPSSADERVKRLVELKKARGWTWSRIAREVGVVQATVDAWIYRKVRPSEQHRRRLAEVFGVSVEYIETGQEGPPAINEFAQLAERFAQVESICSQLVDLPRFVGSNLERITDLEAALTRVAEEVEALRELMEGTATAVKALRTAGVAPPQPEPVERPPQERRAIGGRRLTDPPLPPGR